MPQISDVYCSSIPEDELTTSQRSELSCSLVTHQKIRKAALSFMLESWLVRYFVGVRTITGYHDKPSCGRILFSLPSHPLSRGLPSERWQTFRYAAGWGTTRVKIVDCPGGCDCEEAIAMFEEVGEIVLVAKATSRIPAWLVVLLVGWWPRAR